MSKWPLALPSMYILPSANQPIVLHQGKILIRNRWFSAEGSGEIRLHWNPRKQIVFEVAAPFTPKDAYGEAVEVMTTELDVGAPGKLLLLEHSFKDNSTATKFSGLLGALGIAYGTSSLESEKVVFHLANFDTGGGADFIANEDGRFWAGRHSLQTGKWLITIDSLDTKISKELEQQGGYCITQVCKLERQDGTTFSAETAQNILEALSYFLSFTRGLWVPSLLPFGVNGASEVAWRLLDAHFRASPWQSIDSSFRTSPFSPQQSFAHFLERWNNALWHDSIKRCVHWYVEASLKAGGTEGSIILVAAAFELLAWTLFFEDPEFKIYEDEKFFDEKVPAKTKLELLIKWVGASTKLPMRYAALKELAKQRAWNNNGAEIFLTVRNNLTHSSPKNRQARFDIPSEALHETYMVGMRYLKGFIQKLLGYPNPLPSATSDIPHV